MTTPMALGPFGFHSLRFGFNGISRQQSTRWANIPVAGGFDQLQWTGGDGDTVEIEGVIFPEEFGGLGTLEGVRAAATSGVVLPLVSLAGNVFGLYVIERVSEDQSFHDRFGLPRKDVFRISLARFPGNVFSPLSVISALF